MARPRYIVRFLNWTGCGWTHKTRKDHFTDENKKSDKSPAKLINTLNRTAKFARCVAADRFGEFYRFHVGQALTKPPPARAAVALHVNRFDSLKND